MTPPPIPANPGPYPSASQLDYQDCVATTPSVRETVLGWLRPITVGFVTDMIDDTGQNVPITRQLNTAGCIQPLKSRELEIKPEGERAWGWYCLYATRDLQLKTDDKVILRGVTYRVMAKRDWFDYGYVRYELLQGYQDATQS